MDPERSDADSRTEPTSEDVAQTLRARIDSGELKPGQVMPTQAVLAEEFAVPRGVIRGALGILSRQHLLTESRRGAPSRIVHRHHSGSESGIPQQTLVALGPRIMDAFTAPAVRIDALCLTAESLSASLGEPRRLLQQRKDEGLPVPSSIHVRVLLPDRDIDLAFPRGVDDGSDDRRLVHNRWLRQRNAHGAVLRDHLLGLGARLGIPVDVQFRALPFTPPVKLYVLNGAEALFAYYQLTRDETPIAGTTVEMYDTKGDQSPLFSFVSGEGAGRKDASFVALSQAWFDSIWDTIVSNLVLE